MAEQLLGSVLVVGALGGVAGAGYLAVLHLLQAVLWPEHHTPAASPVLLVVVGVAIHRRVVDGSVPAGRRDLRPSADAGNRYGPAAAKLVASAVTVTSGWRGGFIIPLFFVGTALGKLGGRLLPGADEIVLVAALMAAINAGVTKTPPESTTVVSEMAGLLVLPTRLLATIVALLLTSGVGVIASQRERSGSVEADPRDLVSAEAHEPPRPEA